MPYHGGSPDYREIETEDGGKFLVSTGAPGRGGWSTAYPDYVPWSYIAPPMPPRGSKLTASQFLKCHNVAMSTATPTVELIGSVDKPEAFIFHTSGIDQFGGAMATSAEYELVWDLGGEGRLEAELEKARKGLRYTLDGDYYDAQNCVPKWLGGCGKERREEAQRRMSRAKERVKQLEQQLAEARQAKT